MRYGNAVHVAALAVSAAACNALTFHPDLEGAAQTQGSATSTGSLTVATWTTTTSTGPTTSDGVSGSTGTTEQFTTTLSTSTTTDGESGDVTSGSLSTTTTTGNEASSAPSSTSTSNTGVEDLCGAETPCAGKEKDEDPGDGCLQCQRVRTVFVTDLSFDGNLGGVDGANQKCNDAAKDQFVGTFQAWVGTNTGNAAADDPALRLGGGLGGDIPLYRPDGERVADSWHNFVGTVDDPWWKNGSYTGKNLENPIFITNVPGLMLSGEHVWTGAGPDGFHLLLNCSNWSENQSWGRVGDVDDVNHCWSDDNIMGDEEPADQKCGDKHHLICIQDPL